MSSKPQRSKPVLDCLEKCDKDFSSDVTSPSSQTDDEDWKPVETEISTESSSESSSEEFLPPGSKKPKPKPGGLQKAELGVKRKPVSKNIFRRRRKESNDEIECNELSEMQIERKKNIDERMRFFNQLAITEAKKAFEDSTKRVKKPRSTAAAQPKEPIAPRQKSERIQSKKGDTNSAVATSSLHYKSQEGFKLQPMSSVMFKPFNKVDFEDYFGRLQNKLLSKSPIKSDIDFRYCSLESFVGKIEGLTLRHEQNMKVVPSPITALAIHPSKSAMLVAAGSKSGSVGLWSVDVEAGDWDDTNLIVFEPHKGKVTSMSFSATANHIFYTTSLDGTVQRGDLNKQIFETVFSSQDNHTNTPTSIFWHCEHSQNVLYAAQEGGMVARVDLRLSADCARQKLFRCHFESIRTVSLHPRNREQLLTCSDDSYISLWDLRTLGSRGISGRLWNKSLDRPVISAFFSPLSGSRILTTLGTDTISILDTAKGQAPFKSWEQRRSHCTPSRPPSCPYKAVWHPLREDSCAIARVHAPFGVEVFECNYTTEPLHAPRRSKLLEGQRCTIAEFHPSLPAVAASCVTNVHLFL